MNLKRKTEANENKQLYIIYQESLVEINLLTICVKKSQFSQIFQNKVNSKMNFRILIEMLKFPLLIFEFLMMLFIFYLCR